MALTTLPSYAKIRELRLAIQFEADDPTRPLTRKRQWAVPFRELWRGEILLAPMSPGNSRAFAAWLEQFDGPVSPLGVSLGAGKFGQAASHTGAIQANTSLGDSHISLALSPASGTLQAGTLIAIGNQDTDNYQVVETLTDTPVGAVTKVEIAPRIRRTFTTASAVAIGTVIGKYTLAGNAVDSAYDISQGVAAFEVVEVA